MLWGGLTNLSVEESVMNGSNERIPRRRLLKDVAALATAGVFFPQILARHAVGAETVDKAGILGFSCIPLCFWKEMYTEKTMSYEAWIGSCMCM